MGDNDWSGVLTGHEQPFHKQRRNTAAGASSSVFTYHSWDFHAGQALHAWKVMQIASTGLPKCTKDRHRVMINQPCLHEVYARDRAAERFQSHLDSNDREALLKGISKKFD